MPSPLLHDISFDMEYATRESREATFPIQTKRSKAGWPHKTPTPAALAKAGFYYKPSPHSNDNTACFLCDRNLDGWESEDDPVQEHLKHADDCGWAVMMSLEAVERPDAVNIEDPTAQRLTDARRATFAVGWPHESKRGWTCKIEKMVEAGWYFAPTTGSEDYVSCSYCKLSLDGWEPKDNPFEEHYTRSPSCPFFVYAGTTAPSKRPKAKKSRASRASRTSKASTRLSTQSNATIQNDTSTIPDLEDSIDTSNVSLLSTASTATTKSKRKAGTTRTKSTKSKRVKTTKTKQMEELETQTEAQVIEDAAAVAVAYPQLQSESQPERGEQLDQLDSVLDQPDKDDEMKNHIQQPSDIVYPEVATGPPELPEPTIPVSVESPVPKSAQTKRSRLSATRSVPKKTIERTPPPASRSSPLQPSDVENAPPSARPESTRPPLSSPGKEAPVWTSVDVDMIFEDISGVTSKKFALTKDISEAERQMSVQEWIKFIAGEAESELRAEAERVVGIFEKEGQKALRVLEGIVCT